MDSHDRFGAILVICGTVIFLVLMGASFLDGAHKRTVSHACHMAGFSAQYDSAHIAQICGA